MIKNSFFLPRCCVGWPCAPSSTLDAVLERGVLRVGFDAGYQPFEMTNKQGQYIGFDVTAKMVAK